MRGIANAQEPRPIPLTQTVDRDRKQLDVAPVAKFADAIAEVVAKSRDFGAERLQAPLLDGAECALRYHERTLPVVAPVDHHEHPACLDAPEGPIGIGGLARDPHPQHVYRSTDVD